MSPSSATTTHTSLANRPRMAHLLRWLWMLLPVYILIGFIYAVPHRYQDIQQSSPEIIRSFAGLGLSMPVVAAYDIFLDALFLTGFFAIGLLLFRYKKDDWMALAVGAFMIAFGARVTSAFNSAAILPDHQLLIGGALALGDISVVMLNLLFPDGRFSPRWLRWLTPLLIIHMLLLYTLPQSPLYWDRLGLPLYLANVLPWYHIGLFSSVYRYFRNATPLQRQQIRWFFFGSLGPLLWFLLFQLPRLIFPALANGTVTGELFNYMVRTLGIFLFLIFPAAIAIAIARYRLFEVDLLINRSLVYGSITLALGALFAVALGLVSIFFRGFEQGEQYGLALVIAGLATGTVFQPLRKRIQRFVDRSFYGIQITYDRTPVTLPVRPSGMTEIIRQTRFASYRSLTLIGSGGMAEVYRAEHPSLGRPVAIKILPVHRAEDEAFRKRFQREAQIIAKLTHPNIVRLFDFGEDQGLYYMVLEYLHGPDLAAYLRERGRLPLSQARPLLQQVAAALDYAHSAGLIHRDIKPSNILLDQSTGENRAVLTDFGIAHQNDAGTNLTATGIMGTFDYIAPEQIQVAADMDGRADIYAFGILTYQLLTGELPFRSLNAGGLLLAHLTALPPDPRNLVSELSPLAAGAIQRAMAKAPGDRYATAGEFIADLI